MAKVGSFTPFRFFRGGAPEVVEAKCDLETQVEELRGRLRDAQCALDISAGELRLHVRKTFEARDAAASVTAALGAAQCEIAGLRQTNEALSESLAAVTGALEELAQTETAARAFMDVLAIRGAGGIPLFRTNDDANPEDVAALKHAVLNLQARLEGTPLPAVVTAGRVLN